MINKYLIRLDDACPTMNVAKWQRIFDILDRYGVKPMVGVIPHNEDPMQNIDVYNVTFWNEVKRWESKGYSIALHGYNHCYTSQEGLKGLNPIWRRSEFAGLSLEKQKDKIRKGVEIFHDNGINPKYFFAPSHTFDENTLLALKHCSDIRIISDTIAIKPYKRNGFIFIPQVGGHCSEMKFTGIFIFCLHPSTMSEDDFVNTESFITTHLSQFIEFDQIDFKHLSSIDLKSRILSWLYFTRRKIKGIR